MSSTLEVSRAVLYRFDKFELLPESEELRKLGTRIHLPPQPFRVLLLLIQRAGEIVTRSEIQEALWGSEIFVDYEQGINSAIRRIRFALNDHAETPRFLQTLPRRGYCFVAPVERIEPMPPLPPTRVEPVPELHAVDPWVPLPPPLPPPIPRREHGPRLRRFAVLASLALLLFAMRGPARGRAADAAETRTIRIAIAPVMLDRLQKPRVDPAQIAGELRTRLSRMHPQWIRIVQPSAPNDLRIELNLLDAGDAIRVDARLSESGTGKVVWTETFNRNVGDTSDFPLEVALRVTQAVSSRYLPRGRGEPLVRTRVSAKALALYREARDLRSRPMPQRDLDGALVRFQKAVELEPDFAEAWSGIGDVWSERAEAWMGESRTVALTQARMALDRALGLDPECSEALNDYGRLVVQHGHDYGAAEKWLRRAIAADPEYLHPHINLAILLAAMGNHDEAVASFQRAQLLDPNECVPSLTLAYIYFMGHRYNDALGEYHAALLVGRNAFPAGWGMMWSSRAMQRWDAAARSLAVVLEEPVDLGDRPDGARFHHELRRLEPLLLQRQRAKRLDPYVLACYYSTLHDADRAFLELDRSIADESMQAIFTFVDPRLDWIRSDPRFEARLQKLGFRR